ncbi:MAG: sodium/solute symporter [Lachnospiraceae bacterium]|nr:sodium/solute symporter [Lachnospiraceae bacterium]
MVSKIIMLVVFFAVMIGVGVYTRKAATDVNGFVLGGRNVGPWLTAFAYGTSYFSAVVFVGYAGQFGYKYGLSSTWIGIGNALIGSLLAWVILGRRTRVMSKHLNSATMPDFLGKRYHSKAIRIVAALISFIFLIPYTASVYNGLSRLFGMAFNVPYSVCVIVMAVLTGAYVILGGYMATAVNDFIQGIIMLFGIVAVVVSVINGNGGFYEAYKNLSAMSSDVAVTEGLNGAFVSFFGPDPANLLGVVILTSLGTWGLPQMVQKFYAIKDERSIRRGTIISTFFAVVVAGGCYFLGGFARLADVSSITVDGKIVYDAIIPTMLSKLPDLLIGIVVVLVLSASMSTLSSLVLTSSSTLTLDLIKDNFVKKMSEKKQLLIMRIFIVVFIVISVVIAMDPPTFIAQLMGISWGALAGAFLAPLLYGLYWKGATRGGVWAGFIFAVGFTVANVYTTWANPINAGALAMVGGLVIVPVVSLITPKLDKGEIDFSFSCYEKKKVVEEKIALPEDVIQN